MVLCLLFEAEMKCNGGVVMITVVQKVVNYVRNTLYQGREPDENGFYIYNTSEIARAIGTSPRQISIRKENSQRCTDTINTVNNFI